MRKQLISGPPNNFVTWKPTLWPAVHAELMIAPYFVATKRWRIAPVRIWASSVVTHNTEQQWFPRHGFPLSHATLGITDSQHDNNSNPIV